MLSEKFLEELHKPETKGFLWALYEIDANDGVVARKRRKKVLRAATNANLDLLIDCLSAINDGLIKVKLSHFHAFKRARKMKHFSRYFENESDVKALKKQSKRDKVDVLYKVCSRT